MSLLLYVGRSIHRTLGFSDRSCRRINASQHGRHVAGRNDTPFGGTQCRGMRRPHDTPRIHAGPRNARDHRHGRLKHPAQRLRLSLGPGTHPTAQHATCPLDLDPGTPSHGRQVHAQGSGVQCSFTAGTSYFYGQDDYFGLYPQEDMDALRKEVRPVSARLSEQARSHLSLSPCLLSCGNRHGTAPHRSYATTAPNSWRRFMYTRAPFLTTASRSLTPIHPVVCPRAPCPSTCSWPRAMRGTSLSIWWRGRRPRPWCSVAGALAR